MWWMLQPYNIGSRVRDVSFFWRPVLLSLPFLRLNQWHFQRPRDWFTQGTLSRMGRLYSWRDPPISAPGRGTSHGFSAP